MLHGQVARCEEKEFSDQKREAMSVADFCQYWQKRQREGDAASGDQEKRTYDQERATESQEETTGGEDGGEGLLYLKDWHFAQVPFCPSSFSSEESFAKHASVCN